MSDEATTNESNGTGNTVSHNQAPQPPPPSSNTEAMEALRYNMRAVTRERDDFKRRFQNAQQQLQALQPFKEKAESLESTLSNLRRQSSQNLSLADMGIRSARARRTILREYQDEHRDTPEADRPKLSEYVDTLKGDPFFGRLFQDTTAATTTASTTVAGDETSDDQAGDSETGNEEGEGKKRAKRRARGANGDVNNGANGNTSGDGGNDQLDYNTLQRQRAQSGGRLSGKSLQSAIEKLKAQGVIA